MTAPSGLVLLVGGLLFATGPGPGPDRAVRHEQALESRPETPFDPFTVRAGERSELTPPTRVATSPPVRGLGARLAMRIRDAGLGAEQRFLARGVSPEQIRACGGRVTATLGPIVAGTLSGEKILALAPQADLIESPQPLRPLLDISRRLIHADVPQEGRRFPTQYRGQGALLGIYDSGVDLAHPDLRMLNGPSRIVALWDQTLRSGTPPMGFDVGRECKREQLVNNVCPSVDLTGHGTLVASIAAGSGPEYRGIAPDAGLVVARSDHFELLLQTLRWFADVQAREQRPLIVNLSIGGHEGPHDGTSLECQAIDALPHLVVAAAGNEGVTPVHAQVATEPDVWAGVMLRFPVTPGDGRRKATVDVWGPGGAAPMVGVLVVDASGAPLARSSTVTPGSQGVTEDLTTGSINFGRVRLDAEATPSPFNQRSHVRIQLDLENWQDAPSGLARVLVRVAGRGRLDLWVDTPAEITAPVSFETASTLSFPRLVSGDTESSISDIATALSALTVSAFNSRVGLNDLHADSELGEITAFSSKGPTLAPNRTGPKPDLAAPGAIIIGARSSKAPIDPSTQVTALYQAAAGTSFSAAHASGAAALIAGAQPAVGREDLKKILLDSASRDGLAGGDARWGAGKLDAEQAVALGLGSERGCGCAEVGRRGNVRSSAGLLLLFLALGLVRPRNRGAPRPPISGTDPTSGAEATPRSA